MGNTNSDYYDTARHAQSILFGDRAERCPLCSQRDDRKRTLETERLRPFLPWENIDCAPFSAFQVKNHGAV